MKKFLLSVLFGVFTILAVSLVVLFLIRNNNQGHYTPEVDSYNQYDFTDLREIKISSSGEKDFLGKSCELYQYRTQLGKPAVNMMIYKGGISNRYKTREMSNLLIKVMGWGSFSEDENNDTQIFTLPLGKTIHLCELPSENMVGISLEIPKNLSEDLISKLYETSLEINKDRRSSIELFVLNDATEVVILIK